MKSQTSLGFFKLKKIWKILKHFVKPKSIISYVYVCLKLASLDNKIHRAYSNSRWSTHCLCYYALFLFLERMNMTSTCLDLFTFFTVVAKIYRCKKKFQAFHPFIYTVQTHPEIVLTSRKICPKKHFNFDSIQRFKTFKVLATFFFICSTSSQQQYFTIVYSYLTFLICKSACPKGSWMKRVFILYNYIQFF